MLFYSVPHCVYIIFKKKKIQFIKYLLCEVSLNRLRVWCFLKRTLIHVYNAYTAGERAVLLQNLQIWSKVLCEDFP